MFGPQPPQMRADGQAEMAAEFSGEVNFMTPRRLGDLSQAERPQRVFVDEFPRGAKPRRRSDAFRRRAAPTAESRHHLHHEAFASQCGEGVFSADLSDQAVA